MKKKLAVLGASYLQLPLVEKAVSNGIEVYCFAWDDGRAVCKNIATKYYDISVLDFESILIKSKELEIDGIVTIATDICIPVIAKIANSLNLIGNSEECAKMTTDKIYMKTIFENNRIPCAKLFSYEDVCDYDFNLPLIVKPVDRSGSLGVNIVHNLEDFKEAYSLAKELSLTNRVIVEQYLKGFEISVETLSFGGRHEVIAVTDKIVTDLPYFVEIEHHQPSQLSDEIINSVKSLSIKVLDSMLVENGASHIEMKIDSQGNLNVIEIGSRMGGDFIGSDLVQLSTGVDYLQAVIDIALNQFDFNNYLIKESNYSGVYFLSKNTENLLRYFYEDVACIVRKEIINPELKYLKSSNDRSGYLIYNSNKREYFT